MRREEFPVGRPDWERTIEEEGLTYSIDFPGDVHYWNEYAAYVFTPEEMDALRADSEELHRMCLQAVAHMASGAYGTLGLPAAAFELAKASWNAREQDFYGRFDLVYSGITGQAPKLLEYNADTPTGIVEAAVSQRSWYVEQRLDNRSYVHFNELGEAFIGRWKHLFAAELTAFAQGKGPQPHLHLAHVPDEVDPSGEDKENLWLLAHAAREAGIATTIIPIDEVIFDEANQRWVDADGTVISNLFKLYPWEDMVTDSEAGYDRLLFAYYDRLQRWIEPAWKMFLSNKLLLAALWELNPGHKNLVPTFAGHDGGLRNWVRKPIFGREGDGIEIHAPDYGVFAKPEEDDFFNNAPESEFVYQEYVPIPEYTGIIQPSSHPVIGSWVVAGRCVGLGIRETNGPVTDYYARFVPNLVKAEGLL